METSKFEELIPGLPDELGLDCLTRFPLSVHPVGIRVCLRWRQLLESDEFDALRKKFGRTHVVACLVQALPPAESNDGQKQSAPHSYGITVFDPVSSIWERLESIPDYPNGLPLFCQLAGCDGNLVVMGGWHPTSYDPVTDLFVYDFRKSQWKRGKSMPSKRTFYAMAAFAGRVYIAGGHDENKNALKTAWVYDVKRDQWEELSPMSKERDECEGVVVGNEFWVVSGYTTENQGAFDGSIEAYDFGSGKWRQMDGTWTAGRCPRSCVGVRKEGILVNWADLDSEVRVGVCGVGLGDRTLVTGAEYQGGTQGFYHVMQSQKEGQKCKLDKVNVPEEFSGFVQSGCPIEL